MMFRWVCLGVLMFVFLAFRTANNPDFEVSMLQKLNQLRGSKHPLKTDSKLIEAAQIQLKEILGKETLTHQNKNKKWKTIGDRVEFAAPNTYYYWGENILFFPVDDPDSELEASVLAQKCFLQWKNSRGHFLNMKNKNYTHVGHAFQYHAHSQRVYAVQVFGGE